MKTSSFPSLRVNPELRRAAESVLKQGESLSSFVEHSIRMNIERRRIQQEFIARGLASRAEAKQTDTYYSAVDVLDELGGMLDKAEAKAKAKK